MLGDPPQEVEGDVRVLHVAEVHDAADELTDRAPVQSRLGDALRGVIAADEEEQGDEDGEASRDVAHGEMRPSVKAGNVPRSPGARKPSHPPRQPG